MNGSCAAQAVGYQWPVPGSPVLHCILKHPIDYWSQKYRGARALGSAEAAVWLEKEGGNLPVDINLKKVKWAGNPHSQGNGIRLNALMLEDDQETEKTRLMTASVGLTGDRCLWDESSDFFVALVG